MVIGEGKRFIFALITLKSLPDLTSGLPTENLSDEAKDYLLKTLELTLMTTTEAIINT